MSTRQERRANENFTRGDATRYEVSNDEFEAARAALLQRLAALGLTRLKLLDACSDHAIAGRLDEFAAAYRQYVEVCRITRAIRESLA